MEKVALLTESQIADLIRQTALAVANDLREDLRTAGTRTIMNTAELADYLGCSRVTIHRYMKEGMPHQKIGNGHPTFRTYEVDNWLRLKTCERV